LSFAGARRVEAGDGLIAARKPAKAQEVHGTG
jgi:hypothetical protein